MVAVGLFGAAACSDDGIFRVPHDERSPIADDPRPGNVDGVLRIGYLLPTSGQSATVGPPMIKGIEMAVRDINAAGGVNGEQVTLVGGDEGDDPSVAGVTLDNLLNVEKIDVLIGPASSTTALRVLGRRHQCGRAHVLTLEHRPRARAVPRRRVLRAHRTIRPAAGRRALRGHRRRWLSHDRADEPERRLRQRHGRRARRSAEDPGHPGDDQLAVRPERHQLRSRRAQGPRDRPESIAVIGLPDTAGLILRKLVDLGAGPDRLPTFVTDGLRVPNLYQSVDPTRPEVTAGIRGTSVATVPSTSDSDFATEFAAFAPGHR